VVGVYEVLRRNMHEVLLCMGRPIWVLSTLLRATPAGPTWKQFWESMERMGDRLEGPSVGEGYPDQNRSMNS
jgi:hypothetical protein